MGEAIDREQLLDRLGERADQARAMVDSTTRGYWWRQGWLDGWTEAFNLIADITRPTEEEATP